MTSKGKLNTKRLQISTYDENTDTINLTEDIPHEPKKKTLGNSFSCRQKKKISAKKSKVI